MNAFFFFPQRPKQKVFNLGLGEVEHLAQHFYYTSIPPCLKLKLLDKLWQVSPFHFAVTTSLLPCLLISLLPKFLLNPYENNMAQLIE